MIDAQQSADAAALPVVGASLWVHELRTFADWLQERERDVELKDPCLWRLWRGDWKATADMAHAVLGGYSGRISVHAQTDGVSWLTSDPDLLRILHERMAMTFEFMLRAGATHVVVHSPFPFYGDASVVHHLHTDLEGLLQRVANNLEPLLRRAQESGLTVVVENINDTHPGALEALCGYVNGLPLRLSVDTGHARIMQERGGLEPQDWIARIAPWLDHIHLADNDALADRHWAPGKGIVDWKAVFSAMQALPSRPRLILECPPAEMRSAVAWLAQQGLAS